MRRLTGASPGFGREYKPGGADQPPLWATAYVGLPFVDLGRDRDGVDCWGLVRLILAERAGVDVPSLATSYHSEADTDAVAGVIESERHTGDWLKIPAGEERAFDVAEISMPVRTVAGWRFGSLHVGIVVSPGWLIHVEHSTDAALTRYRTDQAMRRRVLGFWRHRELAKR